jgi:hypothetical protein
LPVAVIPSVALPTGRSLATARPYLRILLFSFVNDDTHFDDLAKAGKKSTKGG